MAFNTTFTFDTLDVLLDEAEEYYSKKGMDMTSAMNLFLIEAARKNNAGSKIKLEFVSDKDVPEEVWQSFKEYDQLPQEEIVTFTNPYHVH